VEVSVEDTGEGMTPEILERVTEPFFTTKAVDKGTGLGLSITLGVIKAHGGTMEMASTPEHGTQVKVRLPRHLIRTEETTILQPQPWLGLSKVLVVDDEEEVRTMLARMLRMAGADKVKTVASGQDALVSLDSGDIPDLIILDHNMPGLNGAQTLALIRLGHQDIPIILASGEPDIEGRDAYQQRMVGIIPKPFTWDEIRSVLARLGVGVGEAEP
jgi:CheY-like chemotaxis protein